MASVGASESVTELRARAKRARRRFYGRLSEGVESPPPVVEVAARRPVLTVEKQGKPCPKDNRGLAAKAVSLVTVLASRDVPPHVYQERMAACAECPYMTKARGHHWCGCCGCGKWFVLGLSSSLEFKNRKAAQRCPSPEPVFGPWEPSESDTYRTGFEAGSKVVRE